MPFGVDHRQMKTIGDVDRHYTVLAVFLPAILDFERETIEDE